MDSEMWRNALIAYSLAVFAALDNMGVEQIPIHSVLFICVSVLFVMNAFFKKLKLTEWRYLGFLTIGLLISIVLG